MERYEQMVANRPMWSVIGVIFKDRLDSNLGN